MKISELTSAAKKAEEIVIKKYAKTSTDSASCIVAVGDEAVIIQEKDIYNIEDAYIFHVKYKQGQAIATLRKTEKNKAISIYLDGNIISWIDDQRNKLNMSRSEFVNHILREVKEKA